jgi:hypothetical protein
MSEIYFHSYFFMTKEQVEVDVYQENIQALKDFFSQPIDDLEEKLKEVYVMTSGVYFEKPLSPAAGENRFGYLRVPGRMVRHPEVSQVGGFFLPEAWRIFLAWGLSGDFDRGYYFFDASVWAVIPYYEKEGNHPIDCRNFEVGHDAYFNDVRVYTEGLEHSSTPLVRRDLFWYRVRCCYGKVLRRRATGTVIWPTPKLIPLSPGEANSIFFVELKGVDYWEVPTVDNFGKMRCYDWSEEAMARVADYVSQRGWKVIDDLSTIITAKVCVEVPKDKLHEASQDFSQDLSYTLPLMSGWAHG